MNPETQPTLGTGQGESQDVKNLNDVYERPPMEETDGEKVDKTSLYNKPIVIKKTTDRQGTKGNYLTIEFHLDGKPDNPCWFNNGGAAVVEKLTQVKEKDGFPLRVILIRQKSQKTGMYYDDIIDVRDEGKEDKATEKETEVTK